MPLLYFFEDPQDRFRSGYDLALITVLEGEKSILCVLSELPSGSESVIRFKVDYGVLEIFTVTNLGVPSDKINTPIGEAIHRGLRSAEHIETVEYD